MLTINVKITGTQEAIAKLRRLNSGLNNFTEAFNMIGEELVGYYSGQVFSSQGGVLGVKWPTLSAKTQMYKRKHYPQYATTPLIRSGEMQQSFKAESTPKTLTVYNTAPYFKYHQSSEARTKIPYRPMIGINSDVMNIVQKIIKADIEQKIKAA